MLASMGQVAVLQAGHIVQAHKAAYSYLQVKVYLDGECNLGPHAPKGEWDFFCGRAYAKFIRNGKSAKASVITVFFVFILLSKNLQKRISTADAQ